MLKNPVVGVMIGVFVTVLIQPSSISTPIIGDREPFRKPFARANVHDMSNWLSAFILVITESLTGYLEFLTGKLVEDICRVDYPRVKAGVKQTCPLEYLLLSLQ